MGHRQHVIPEERYILFSVCCSGKQGRVKYVLVLLSNKSWQSFNVIYKLSLL